MNFEGIRVLEQNITLVYPSIDLKNINTQQFKRLLKVAPTVMDTPEMVVVIYPTPTGPTIIQIADDRIRITLQGQTDDLSDVGGVPGGVRLWKMALESHNAINGSELVAYGFNYKVGVTIIEGDAQTLLNNKFMLNVSGVSGIVQSEDIEIMPRVKFRRGETRYDIILEVLEEKKVVAHFNAHFDVTTFPTQKELRTSFQDEFDYFMSFLPKLFQGGSE